MDQAPSTHLLQLVAHVQPDKIATGRADGRASPRAEWVLEPGDVAAAAQGTVTRRSSIPVMLLLQIRYRYSSTTAVTAGSSNSRKFGAAWRRREHCSSPVVACGCCVHE